MTYRWGDSAHTSVIRESDGASIPADPRNKDYSEALGAGEIAPYQRWTSLAQAKAELTGVIEAHAARLRVAVAGTNDATKLTVYREKYATALDALAGDAASIAALEPEASARGQSVAELAGLVKTLGEQWRAAGLSIDASYQGHKAAIAALADIAAAEAYSTSAGWPF